MSAKKAKSSAKKATPAKSATPVADNKDKTFQEFWQEFWRYTPEFDRDQRSQSDWEVVAQKLFQLLHGFKGESQIRSESLTYYSATDDREKTVTGFFIVTPDMTYIISSVVNAFKQKGYEPRAIIHPTIFAKVSRGGISGLCGPDTATKDLAPIETIYLETDLITDAAERKAIEEKILSVLGDLEKVTEDQDKLWQTLRDVGVELSGHKALADRKEQAEVTAFIDWLSPRNFTLLGYRKYGYSRNHDEIEVRVIPNKGLGMLRDDSLVLAEEKSLARDSMRSTSTSFLNKKRVMTFSKSSYHATVQRNAYYDRFGFRIFDEEGNVVGGNLFIGLFSPHVFEVDLNEIPIVRDRIKFVYDQLDFPEECSNRRMISEILRSYPRGELFLTSREQLAQNVKKVLDLQGRPHPVITVRHDLYERYVSCLIFVPRDLYSNALAVRLQKYLGPSFNGQADQFSIFMDDDALARIHIQIVQKDNEPLKHIAIDKLEAEIRDICSPWQEKISKAVAEKLPAELATNLTRRYQDAFSISFQETHKPDSAVEDIISIEKLVESSLPVVLAFTKHENASEKEAPYHLSFYHEGEAISPLRLLRIVENFGLTPISDSHYTCNFEVNGEAREVHIHDFPIASTPEQWEKLDPRQDVFEEALQAIWQRYAGNDRLNELLFLAEMNLPEVILLRAIGRYLMQARLPYSQEYYAEMLVRHAPVMRNMVDYFHARFDPKNHSEAKAKKLLAECENYITQVKSLDEDRVLRRVLNVMQSTVRTNYYQRDNKGADKPQLSFKIKSIDVLDLPRPVPMYETFVYAHRVEGIHLRSSRISRGGIRWSDRREDFRDEILDLMKAQTVKNSVIVPTGAKGGFYVKYPPLGGDRKAMQAEAIACYQIFIRGLLDITDNRVGKKIVRPANVVCYDDEDPYLVVAADKGTATFSDIANTISKEYGHWLGDAFASGGSAGYDHKVMGITARGAWESVRHHGYHLGINVDKDPIKVMGVGDMGGDVFGNGLLRSPHLKLIGAFSYSHIFCDPDPDPAKSFAERERLFKIVANWDQYNPKLLSKGGRIYSRADKELVLTPEIKVAFGIEVDKLTPTELMQAMLRARVDLLWFGGIGTYVKASTELDVDVRDKANDPIRINGNELRAKIIGEGANLGMTQRGRIEAAQSGVALNTDFIDNSAGVNTSDYEVNIKILLNGQVAGNHLTLDKRNKLLEAMTDEVAALVLENNKAQNTAIGVAQEMSAGRIEHFGRLIHELEDISGINRKLEALPTDADLTRIMAEGGALTRPEISVILSHTKLLITHILAKDSLMEEAAVLPLINAYFPKEIVKLYPDAVKNYALRPQLAAMLLANQLINQASVYIPKWLSDRTGLGYADIARAFLIVANLFDFSEHWEAVHALEHKVTGRVQRELLVELLQHTDRTMPWFLNQNELLKDVNGTVNRFLPHFEKLHDNILSILPTERRHARNNHEQRLIAEGVPKSIAETHANIRSLAAAPSVVALALDLGKPVLEIGKLYFQIGERFGFDGLRERARQSMRNEYWQRQAISALIEDFSSHQLRLTRAVVLSKMELGKWIESEHQMIERLDALMRELQTDAMASVTQLTVANRRLRGLVPIRTGK